MTDPKPETLDDWGGTSPLVSPRDESVIAHLPSA